MAENVNLGGRGEEIFGGTTVTFTFALVNTATSSVGWTTRFAVKQHLEDTSTILLLTPTAASTTPATWNLTLTKAQTLSLAAIGTYVYSFERIDTGAEEVLTWGQLQITRKAGPTS